MAYTVDDFMRDTYELIARDLAALAPQLRAAALAHLDVEERLAGLTPEERLRGLAPEERLRDLDPEDRLRGLAPELIKTWLKRSDHGSHGAVAGSRYTVYAEHPTQ